MLETIIHKLKTRTTERAGLLQRCRRGVTMLIIVLSTTVIFGFAALAVDFGMLTVDKNRWQRAVDAAALAGAQELKKTTDETTNTTKARNMAVAVAGQNGITVDPAKVTFLNNNTQIRVESANIRDLSFARVIGIPQGRVSAFAVAAVARPIYGVPLPIPISVTYTTLLSRRNATDLPLGTLKSVSEVDPTPVVMTIPRVQDAPYGLNEFLVFDLRGAKAAPQMSKQLISGDSDVAVGDLVTSLNADEDVVNSNFTPAIAQRFQNSAQAPWNDTWTGNVGTSSGIRYNEIISGKAPADNPRVMSFIVNSPMLSNSGTTQHKVLAFAPVYVESWQNDQLTIRFLPDSLFGGSNGGKRTVSLTQ